MQIPGGTFEEALRQAAFGLSIRHDGMPPGSYYRVHYVCLPAPGRLDTDLEEVSLAEPSEEDINATTWRSA